MASEVEFAHSAFAELADYLVIAYGASEHIY
jgi:hypothetical protein